MNKVILLSIFFTYLLVASDIIYLGNPYKKQYKDGEYIYARNIWDMQYYNGKIYLGAGNSSNYHPAPNSGRVYVVSLNTKTNRFNYEYKVAEEQIDKYEVYDQKLYISGHDATQKWTFGNIYEKDGFKKWKKYRTIPKALHIYDLLKLKDRYYVAVGMKHKGAVLYSYDKKRWFFYKTVPHRRVYSIFDLNGKVYLDSEVVSKRYKMIKAIKLDSNRYIYIKAKVHNDHQNIPIELKTIFVVDNKLKKDIVKLPKSFLPRDILKRDSILYILATKKQQNSYRIIVLKYTIDDLNRYEKIISFTYPTFARSFENYKDSFYFGMGAEIKSVKRWKQSELKKEIGDIIMIKTKRR